MRVLSVGLIGRGEQEREGERALDNLKRLRHPFASSALLEWEWSTLLFSHGECTLDAIGPVWLVCMYSATGVCFCFSLPALVGTSDHQVISSLWDAAPTGVTYELCPIRRHVYLSLPGSSLTHCNSFLVFCSLPFPSPLPLHCAAVVLLSPHLSSRFPPLPHPTRTHIHALSWCIDTHFLLSCL
jgi:hypothetical protein